MIGLLKLPVTLFYRLTESLSHRTTHRGITVSSLGDDEAPEDLFLKVKAAIDVIMSTAPRRLARIQRDVPTISLLPMKHWRARWLEVARICELDHGYVGDPSTTTASIAVTIVHESTHARLCRLGIGYGERIRPRVEAVCFREQLAFASLLTTRDGPSLVQEAKEQLKRPAADYSNRTYRTKVYDELISQGVARWKARLTAWLSRRRAT